MMKNLTILIVYSAVAMVFADPGSLGPQHNVASGNRPDVFSDSSGNPHVVYESSGICYVKGDGVSGNFSTPVKISGSGQDARIIIDENDNAHAVWTSGYQAGYYTNNIGGNWKSPLRVLTQAEGGGDRVMLGRVLKVPGKDQAVTVWSVGGTNNVFLRLKNISTVPAVDIRRNVSSIWTPDIALNPGRTGFRTVARIADGAEVNNFSFDLTNTGGTFKVMWPQATGECGSVFRGSNGICHYSGTGAGTTSSKGSPAYAWYNNDTRAGQGKHEIRGIYVGDGTSEQFWADVCVDNGGRGYVSHNSRVSNAAFVAYVEDDTLFTVQIAPSYTHSIRYGPMCAPTAVGGVHVVLPVGSQVIYRAVGVSVLTAEKAPVKQVRPVLCVSPNPFYKKTVISFSAGEKNVKRTLKIFSINGKLIKSFYGTGYDCGWDAGGQPAGFYIAQWTTGNKKFKTLMVHMK